jgi:hypothetical protein
VTAADRAAEQVAAVRDDPPGRLALLRRCYDGPSGSAPRHLPYRRAATSFMQWQLRRGVLGPPGGPSPGSPWWRAVNERILYDGCEAVALAGGLTGPPTSPTVAAWTGFVRDPTPATWYQAHNASVVAAYLDHAELATGETSAERFFMNVVLCRVLYAHALVARPPLALGRLRGLAPLLGDPRLGMTGIFLNLSRVVPARYPLPESARTYLHQEGLVGHVLDYGMIQPRLSLLYAWSADQLGRPDLLTCIDDGALTYAWPREDGDVWRASSRAGARTVRRLVPP